VWGVCVCGSALPVGGPPFRTRRDHTPSLTSVGSRTVTQVGSRTTLRIQNRQYCGFAEQGEWCVYYTKVRAATCDVTPTRANSHGDAHSHYTRTGRHFLAAVRVAAGRRAGNRCGCGLCEAVAAAAAATGASGGQRSEPAVF